jgi:hypothetical protein
MEGRATRETVGATNAETDIRGAVARRAGRADRRVRANILRAKKGEGEVKRRKWLSENKNELYGRSKGSSPLRFFLRRPGV